MDERAIQAESQARKCGGRAILQWQAKMTDGQTVHSATIYPQGIQERTHEDYKTSIIRTLRMRIPKAEAVNVTVTGLWFAAQPSSQNNKLIL
jgi:hypothetical protein